GRRAAILGAYRAAARCQRAALELCPPHDPARPELLLRHGKSLAAWQGSGVDVLTEAREALLLNGNLTGAASADSELTLLARRRGVVNTAADRVLALLRDAPSSESVAETQCTLAIALAADG